MQKESMAVAVIKKDVEYYRSGKDILKEKAKNRYKN